MVKNNNLNNLNNFNNNLKNNLNLKIANVPLELDILSVVFVVLLVVILSGKKQIPEETKLAFLLALILLISCYNIELGIIVVIIAIVYVLVQNNMKNNEENNN